MNKYKIVASIEIKTLADKIQEYVNQNWNTVGTVFVTETRTQSHSYPTDMILTKVYCQALIKYDTVKFSDDTTFELI